MPSEHERPSMFAPGHRQPVIGPSPSQGQASQQRPSVRNPHYERWYREHHRQRAYEALTQNQIRQAVPTSAPPTASQDTKATEQGRRPPAANSRLLQQGQSSSKARRSSQVINGVLHAGSVASSFAKSPLQNELTEENGGTTEKPGLHLSLISLSIVPPTPPEGETAPTNVPPRQNTDSLTVPLPNMRKPRNIQAEANTQRSTQRKKEQQPPSLTSEVAPPQAEVRNVPVDHQGARPHHDSQRPLPALPVELKVRNVSIDHQGTRQGQHDDAQRPLPAPPAEPAIRNVPVTHRISRILPQGQRHDTHRPLPALSVESAIRIMSAVHQSARPPQQNRHHDTQRPLPAQPVELAVGNVPVNHRDTRPQQSQYHDTQRPPPTPPVELAVDYLPPLRVTGPDLGGLSCLNHLLWNDDGGSGGVQPVIRDGPQLAVGSGNRTIGSFVRPPTLDPLGEFVLPLEGSFELEAGVGVMVELETVVASFAEQEHDYVGDFPVRHEGPPVLPPLLVDDGSVGLDFAPAAAEIGTSAPIYELFTRERTWDFDMGVVEQYKKVCGTNHWS